jgi:hypothetical protein
VIDARRAAIVFVALATMSAAAASRAPIALHPVNPHYFVWKERPAILLTSGEHYGAVLNRPFDYRKYLSTLASHRFNLTRTFSGAYCEPPGAFNIKRNTLAPAAGELVCPWARSDTPGYANGGHKFDLTRWDDAYFERLKDFVRQAGRAGVVVELVLFCPFYEESMWELSPMNASNNINGIGQMKRTDVYTLKDEDLLAVQDAMVRRIVDALKDFDNLYYEICNEPYFGGVTDAWQAHIAETIVEAEAGFQTKHLIAQNIANKSKKIVNPNPHVSIFNFHYAKPPAAVAENYALNKVIGDDETGFAGDDRITPYRLEAWDFILAGGAVFSHLDYSFAVDFEDGTAPIDAPGGGGQVFREQLEVLRDFINGFDFINMRPANSIVRTDLPNGATVRALIEPGRAYALYVKGDGVKELSLELPAGNYKAEWVNTKSGITDATQAFRHKGGIHRFTPPSYDDDIALRTLALARTRKGLLFSSDFEDRRLTGWRGSGNTPEIARQRSRAGRYSLRTSLDRRSDPVSYRTEVSGPRAEVGEEYWYGFSVFLPEDYVSDRVWEIVAQWHGVPDFETGETWRNPVMALSTTGGRWSWVSRWDAKRNTFESGKRQYGGTRTYDLGPYERGVWTDWVVHVKWSYRTDGVLEIWQNGRQVIDQEGPNAFNDAHGPFFKMGLYKGWRDPNRRGDAVSRRVLYHDEFRMGGAEASYADVAPGREPGDSAKD